MLEVEAEIEIERCESIGIIIAAGVIKRSVRHDRTSFYKEILLKPKVTRNKLQSMEINDPCISIKSICY